MCKFPQANALRFPILSTRTHFSICVSPGFHIGLCPHSTLGFAGVPPLQGSLSDCLLFPQGFISGFALISPWAMQEYRPFRAHCRIGRLGYCVVVLCSLNACLGCVNGLLRLVVYLFDCDCIVCGIGGIDLCGRAMSPKGATLLQSPGRKPWVNHWNTFIEPPTGAAQSFHLGDITVATFKQPFYLFFHSPVSMMFILISDVLGCSFNARGTD